MLHYTMYISHMLYTQVKRTIAGFIKTVSTGDVTNV